MRIIVINLLSLIWISAAGAGECKGSNAKNLYDANIVKCKQGNTKWLITNKKYLGKSNTRLPASIGTIPTKNDE